MIGNYKIIALCTARVQDDESNQFIETLNKQAVKKGYRLFVYGVCSDLYWNTDSRTELDCPTVNRAAAA